MTKKSKHDEDKIEEGLEDSLTPAAEESALAENAPPSAEEELAAAKDQLLRALAELDNTRRRSEREKTDASKYAIATFAREMLSVSDNLRRALTAVPDDSELRKDKTADALITGVEMTEKELLSIFKRQGIQEVTPQPGEKFDPHRHQAVFEVPDAPHPPGSVVQVIQAGYIIGDRLLRPAMVGVAKSGAGPSSSAKVDTKV